MTINRFCSSGLQAIALAADRIRSGGADAVIAGGAESMSLTPRGGLKPAPNPWFVDHWPEVYMNMGLTAERLQQRYGISREDADVFALRSHQNAVRGAWSTGTSKTRSSPVEVENVTPSENEQDCLHPRRRPARRHQHRGAAQAQTRVPCERDRHGGQLVADQRRRRRRAGHVGHARRASWA